MDATRHTWKPRVVQVGHSKTMGNLWAGQGQISYFNPLFLWYCRILINGDSNYTSKFCSLHPSL